MTVNLTMGQVLTGVAVLVALGWVWRAGARRATRHQAHQAALAVQAGVDAVSLAARTVVTAGMIVAGQWLVITYVGSRSLVSWLALALPAVLAGFSLVRAFTVTTVIRRGGGR